MSLFWITGSSGTGKSTVCKALKEQGYVAYDVDNDGLARWTNLNTGYVHPKSSVKPEDRTPEFIKTHGWFVPRPTVEGVYQEADGRLGFICGAIDNYSNLQDLFSGILALYVDDDTIKNRLSRRSPREWGTQEHELKQTLERHRSVYDKWRAMGAIVVNSSSPLEQVVDEIVRDATSQSHAA